MGTFGYIALTKIIDEFIYCKDVWGKKHGQSAKSGLKQAKDIIIITN